MEGGQLKLDRPQRQVRIATHQSKPNISHTQKPIEPFHHKANRKEFQKNSAQQNLYHRQKLRIRTRLPQRRRLRTHIASDSQHHHHPLVLKTERRKNSQRINQTYINHPSLLCHTVSQRHGPASLPNPQVLYRMRTELSARCLLDARETDIPTINHLALTRNQKNLQTVSRSPSQRPRYPLSHAISKNLIQPHPHQFKKPPSLTRHNLVLNAHKIILTASYFYPLARLPGSGQHQRYDCFQALAERQDPSLKIENFKIIQKSSPTQKENEYRTAQPHLLLPKTKVNHQNGRLQATESG